MWVKTVPLLALAMSVVLHGVPCDGAASQQPVTFEKEDIKFSSGSLPGERYDQYIQDDKQYWFSADCFSTSCGNEFIEFKLDPPKVIARVTHKTSGASPMDAKRMIIYGSTSTDCSGPVELIQIPDARSKITSDIPEEKKKKFGCLRLDIASNYGGSQVALFQFLIYAEAADAANANSEACPDNMFRYTESTIQDHDIHLEKTGEVDGGTCSVKSDGSSQCTGSSQKFTLEQSIIVKILATQSTQDETKKVKRVNVIGHPDADCANDPEELLQISDVTEANEWDIPANMQKEFQCILLEIKSTNGATEWAALEITLKEKVVQDECYCHPENGKVTCQLSTCTHDIECFNPDCGSFSSTTCPADWNCPNDMKLITKFNTYNPLCQCSLGASTKDHICSINHRDKTYSDCKGFTGCQSQNAAWLQKDAEAGKYKCDIPGDTQQCPCPKNTLIWFDTTEHVCGCKDKDETKICKPSISTALDPKSCDQFACAATVYDEMECVLDSEDKNVFSVIVQGTDVFNMKITSGDKEKTCDKDNVQLAYIRDDEMTSDPREVHSIIPLLLKDAENKEGAKYTRIQFSINDCSSYEKTDGEPPVHKYTTELQLGYTSWMASTIFKLQCDYSQATTADELEIITKVDAETVDDAAQVEADLKILQDSIELPADGAVLGKTLELQATIKGDLGFETAFKYCKVCDKSDCLEADKKYLIGGSDVNEMNCLPEDLKSLDERFNLEVPDDNGEKFTVFKFPAFRFSSSENEKLFLECQLAICKAPGGGDDSPCRKKCGARKRRSAEAAQIEPIHSTATAAIKVVAPPLPHCPSPKTVRGTSRLTCTNGTNVGSICRQDCARGFAADVKGQKTALKICQDQVTDSIGPLIFGMAPAWSPSSSRCYDVNECLENPCPSQSLCRNTLGSYYCKKQY